MKTEEPAPIDEERRRRFEAHRLAGGSEAVAAFLPPEADAAFGGTLEELVAIDLEFRWKRWSQDGSRDGSGSGAPELADYDALLARAADSGVAERIAREQDRLRARFVKPDAAQAVREGTRIGHYVLRALVGRGGFAEVWRAWDESLRRDVAVKCARPELAGDATVVARLVQEARSAARLRHPGIVPVHEVIDRDGRPCIVSDFVEGETLSHAMQGRRFPADDAARIVLQLAEALDYAHACGVVHRDVKPGNVLLPADGRPVLTDFGLARLRASDVALTRHGEVVGTPAYMSPEQARGEVRDADVRSDVYSLGVVLYEMLTGVRPFESESMQSLLYAVVHAEPAPPSARAPGVPRDLETICLRAMAKEPDRRYPTARAFAEDLRRFLDRVPVLSRPLGPWGRARLWVRRNPALATTIAAAAVLVLVVGGVGLTRVLVERRRYRDERDKANAHLYRALTSEAEAHLRAKPQNSQWFDRAMEALRAAAALEVPGRDTRALRDLVLRTHASRQPSFRRTGEWDVPGATPVALAASPDGRLLAAVTDAGTVWVRELAGGAVVSTDALSGARPARLAFVDGGARIALGCGDGSVRLHDPRTLAEAAPPLAGAGAIEALAASPRGDLLAAGRDDGRIDLWRVDAGALVPAQGPPAHEGAATALAFSPDGKQLATGGVDKWIRVRDVATAAEIAAHRPTDPPRALSFSTDGHHLAWCTWETAGWGVVRLAPLPVEAAAFNGGHLSAARDIAFVDELQMITASADGTLRAWGVRGPPVALAQDGGGPIVAAVRVPGTSRMIAARRGGAFVAWDLLAPPGRQMFDTPHVARFVPGTARLVTGRWSYDFRDPERPVAHDPGRDGATNVEATQRQIWGVAVSPDGRRYATTSHDGTVRVRDAATHARVRELQSSGEVSWTCAYSPDSARIASCSGSVVVLWDAASGRELGRTAALADDAAFVAALAFHPTRPLLVSASLDGRVALWDAADLSPRGLLHDAPAGVHGLAFSPDGATLAAACGDGSVLLWQDTGGWTERAPDRRVADGASAVRAVAFDPGGGTLVSGTDQGAVFLHDAKTLAPLATIDGDFLRVRSLSFDDTGHLLAVGCYNGPGVVWDLRTLRGVLASIGLDWK